MVGSPGKHYFGAHANTKLLSKVVIRSLNQRKCLHEEMYTTSFEEWLEQRLLPALTPNTLIVMDNTSYHR